MNTFRSPRRQAQTGAVLMIGMVMLIMLMLIAVGVIRLSMRHTQVVNNEQLRTEATAAANYALDMVLNQPAADWDPYKGAVGKTERVNLGIVGTVDTTENALTVKVSNMECKRARVLKNGELIKTGTTPTGTYKYVPAGDSSCFGGGSTPLVIVDPALLGSPSDDSLCATVLYQYEAEVTDERLLEAQAKATQGVEVRRSIDDLEECK